MLQSMYNQNQSQASPVQPTEPTQQSPEYSSSKTSKSIIAIFVAVIVLTGVGGYVLGTKKSQTVVEDKIVFQPSPAPVDETANPDSIGGNWKTYVDSKYGFSLKYPFQPESIDICYKYPYCLFIMKYSDLYSQLPQGYHAEESGLGANIRTKEEFLDYKDAISNHISPPESKWFTEWKFIKLGGRDAIQAYNYGIYSGSYAIVTAYFNDQVAIVLQMALPTDAVFKQNTNTVYRQIDIEKSIDKLNNLEKELDIDDSSKKIIDEYSKMLSTFKFTANNNSSDNLQDEGLDGFILSSPNGGEILKMGSTQTIEWNDSKVLAEKIAIFLEDTKSIPWKTLTIAANISPSESSYSWTVPKDEIITSGNKYKIIITASINGVTKMGLTDETDGVFEISK